MSISWLRHVNTLNKGVAYLMIVAVLLLFLAGLFSTVQCALKLHFSDWKPVEAVVESSGKYSYSRNSGRVSPFIKYHYTVNGRRYDSQKIWCCSGGRLTSSEASALVTKMKAQQPFIVYYRSSDPSDSFHLPGHPENEPWRMIAITGGGAAVILGFLIFYYLRWSRLTKL